MSGKYLMGLDLGGGGGRCLLIDTTTRESVCVVRSWTHSPAPEAGGLAYKLDTDVLWRTLGELAHEAISRIKISPQDVLGIATTSMRHSMVAIDRNGDVILAIPNKDARAASQSMELTIQRNQELYQTTGHPPSPIFTACRLLWLKENDPNAFKSIHSVMSLSDWVGYKLTGQIACEPSQAAESLVLDLNTRHWSSKIIKSMGLPEKIFPQLKNAGEKLGKLSKEAANNLGLLAGIPVAVGGADSQSGLLGTGVISAGQLGVIAGTTTPIQLVLTRPLIDSQMRTWCGLYIVPGLYVLESNAGQMGTALEWFSRLVYSNMPDPVAVLIAEAETSEPGAHGIFSTIGASVFNAGGMEPPVDNLTFSSLIARKGSAGKADVAQALLEGMAYAVRANVEQIIHITGVPVQTMWLGGGFTRSQTWTKLVSNVMNCKVIISASPESSAIGAAICAGVGAGVYPDLAAGVKSVGTSEHAPSAGHPSQEYIPDEAIATIYQGLYADWNTLREAHNPADKFAASQVTSVMLSSQVAIESSSPSASFRPRIYVSAEVDEAALKQLKKLGEITYAPYRQVGILLVDDDLVQTLKNFQVFVTEVDILSARDLLKLPDLRMVAVCRGNPVNIDINACTAAGVPVIYTPARNADAVADLAMSFILMLARKMQGAVAFLRQPESEAGDLGRMGMAHEEFLGSELWRKTIGVIGGGAVGCKVIQRLLPFGARILLFDPYLTSEQVILMGAEKVSFERLLTESDFITLHASVTSETRNMIDTNAFKRLKPGAFLVNTARAALIDQEALLEALQSGKLGGAALDVFSVEPPGADDPLMAFPNVIVTPHIGGNTFEVAAHQGEIVASELRLLMEGHKPKYIMNPEALDIFSWTGKRRINEKVLRQLASAPGPGVTDLDLAGQVKNKQNPESLDAKSGLKQPTELRSMLLPHHLTTNQNETNESRTTPMNTNINAQREKMIQILNEFTLRIRADKVMSDFAKGKNVVFSFTVKDIDQAFFLSFIDGKVDAGLDNPSREPDVRLKMSADILDGMFTGRVNATRAATSGKLSFSGDTGKAMAFMRIQGNMGRLYAEARDKIGDPGDLTQLGVVTKPSSQPTASPVVIHKAPFLTDRFLPVPADSAPVFSPGIRTTDIRDQILQVASELFAKNMLTPTGGNISTRCEDNPEEIWITPTAIYKGDMRPEMMVRINLDGKILGNTEYTASSERRVHCAIYKLRPDITAVIHTHAPQATLMGLTGTKFLPISTEAAFIGDLPLVPFIMPGTDELGEKIAIALGANGIAVLMQNHGLVVAGSSLRRAADMTDIIEVTSHKILTCKMLGITPVLLPDEIVSTLREIGSMMG